jgi:cyclophilin family peptidyl-prolyl cis-trans isomerase
MGPERSSSIELSGLEDAFDWLKTRKNVLVGAVLVIALGFAVTSFVTRQARESAVQPWRPLFANASEPWMARADDLGAIAVGDARDSDAAAYALYWQALRLFDEGKRADALALLESFKTKYARHPLATARLFRSPPSSEIRSPVDRVVSDMKRWEEWSSSHPTPTANPPANSLHSVTLVTDRGKIVFTLYPELAPRSCEAFLKVAALLKDQFIGKVAPDKWVEIGQTESGAAIETTDYTDGFPPFENNSVYHVTGAVAFRQPPFKKAPFNADLRVMLATDFGEDQRSTVFAQVTEGLDLLSSLSREERKSDAPQMLARPLKITEVTTN